MEESSFMLHVLFLACGYLVDFIMLLIVVRALLSWLPLSPSNGIIRFLDMMTEPVVSPIRRLLNKSETVSQLPVDFSPVIAVIILSILSSLLNTLA